MNAATCYVPKLADELELLSTGVLRVKATGERLERTAFVDGCVRSLQAQVAGDRIVFSGGRDGQHSISIDSELDRVLIHWDGYCDNNGFLLKEGVTVRFVASNVMRRAKVLVTPKRGSKTVRVGSFFFKHGGESAPRRIRVKDAMPVVSWRDAVAEAHARRVAAILGGKS